MNEYYMRRTPRLPTHPSEEQYTHRHQPNSQRAAARGKERIPETTTRSISFHEDTKKIQKRYGNGTSVRPHRPPHARLPRLNRADQAAQPQRLARLLRLVLRTLTHQRQPVLVRLPHHIQRVFHLQPNKNSVRETERDGVRMAHRVHVLPPLVTPPPLELELVFGPTHAPCTPRRASTAPARRIPSCCSHHCAEAPCISKDAPDGDASLARQAWCVADRGRPLPHRFPSPESVPASETPNRPFCLPGLCGWRERRGRGEEHEHEWSRIRESRENPWRSYPHHAVFVVP